MRIWTLENWIKAHTVPGAMDAHELAHRYCAAMQMADVPGVVRDVVNQLRALNLTNDIGTEAIVTTNRGDVP